MNVYRKDRALWLLLLFSALLVFPARLFAFPTWIGGAIRVSP